MINIKTKHTKYKEKETNGPGFLLWPPSQLPKKKVDISGPLSHWDFPYTVMHGQHSHSKTGNWDTARKEWTKAQ